MLFHDVLCAIQELNYYYFNYLLSWKKPVKNVGVSSLGFWCVAGVSARLVAALHAIALKQRESHDQKLELYQSFGSGH